MKDDCSRSCFFIDKTVDETNDSEPYLFGRIRALVHLPSSYDGSDRHICHGLQECEHVPCNDRRMLAVALPVFAPTVLILTLSDMTYLQTHGKLHWQNSVRVMPGGECSIFLLRRCHTDASFGIAHHSMVVEGPSRLIAGYADLTGQSRNVLTVHRDGLGDSSQSAESTA